MIDLLIASIVKLNKIFFCFFVAQQAEHQNCSNLLRKFPEAVFLLADFSGSGVASEFRQ